MLLEAKKNEPPLTQHFSLTAVLDDKKEFLNERPCAGIVYLVCFQSNSVMLTSPRTKGNH